MRYSEVWQEFHTEHVRVGLYDSHGCRTILSDGAKPEQELKVYSNADPTPSEGEIIQPKRGIWRTYDATNGLPGGVWCLFQDRRGFLWLGTEVGLCRYDGTEFITYTTAQLCLRNL